MKSAIVLKPLESALVKLSFMVGPFVVTRGVAMTGERAASPAYVVNVQRKLAQCACGRMRHTHGVTLLTRSLPCPCGSRSYDACCGRLHRGEEQAATPEELMRSRYSAYALDETDYVWRTWHPRTRPPQVTPDPATQWTRLEVIDATDDEVEFKASFEGSRGAGVLHERSRFVRRAGRWFYLDGVSS